MAGPKMSGLAWEVAASTYSMFSRKMPSDAVDTSNDIAVELLPFVAIANVRTSPEARHARLRLITYVRSCCLTKLVWLSVRTGGCDATIREPHLSTYGGLSESVRIVRDARSFTLQSRYCNVNPTISKQSCMYNDLRS